MDRVCSYLAKHPDRADTIIQKINETLQATNKTQEVFAGTINYLNSEENRQKLVNGTSSCTMFFKEVRNATQTDLNNNNADFATSKEEALSIITDALNRLKDIFY